MNDRVHALLSVWPRHGSGGILAGIHALQDAIAHKGVGKSDHLGANWTTGKKLTKDIYGSTEDAARLTRSALIGVDV